MTPFHYVGIQDEESDTEVLDDGIQGQTRNRLTFDGLVQMLDQLADSDDDGDADGSDADDGGADDGGAGDGNAEDAGADNGGDGSP